MSKTSGLKPGQTAPASGQYQIQGPRGGKGPERTVVADAQAGVDLQAGRSHQDQVTTTKASQPLRPETVLIGRGVVTRLR